MKTFEGGWAHQTNGHRAFESVIGISVLIFINVLVFFPDEPNSTYSLVFFGSFIIGALYFLPKKRYSGIIQECNTYREKSF